MMKTAKLLFWCAVAYGILLVFVRGTFPSESSPGIFLAGIPLIVIAVIIARDLARRSTSPTVTSPTASRTSTNENPVQFLRGQIGVAASASNSYFENVIRARLKELLLTKVALETGLERDAARLALSDPKQRLKLLHDQELYTALYGPVPRTGMARMSMIESAIDMIGAWKG